MAHEVFEATPMVRSTDERPSVLIGTHQARRGLDLVAALALVVVALAVAVRVAFLHNQSYWSDETFSVSQASETLGHVFDVGRTEIHTPLNAFHARADGPGGGDAEAVVRNLRLGLTLLAVAAATLVGVFLLSQVV